MADPTINSAVTTWLQHAQAGAQQLDALAQKAGKKLTWMPQSALQRLSGPLASAVLSGSSSLGAWQSEAVDFSRALTSSASSLKDAELVKYGRHLEDYAKGMTQMTQNGLMSSPGLLLTALAGFGITWLVFRKSFAREAREQGSRYIFKGPEERIDSDDERGVRRRIRLKQKEEAEDAEYEEDDAAPVGAPTEVMT